MKDRRFDTRLLCSELVSVSWVANGGRVRRDTGSLDDISESGACLQLEQAVPEEARITLKLGKHEVTGSVRYCVLKDLGYFVGVEFDPDCHWDPEDFEPEHLLDPRSVPGKSREAH